MLLIWQFWGGVESIKLRFNGIDLKVKATSDTEKIIELYHKKLQKLSDAYNNSAKGKAAAAQRLTEVTSKQDRLHKHVADLDGAISGGLKTLIPWIKKYAEDADDISVDYKGDLVFQKLFNAGYRSDEHRNENFVKGNKEVMGRYIVSNVMACLEGDGPFGKMPPHQVTIDFAVDYLAMPDKPSAEKSAKFKP